MILLSTLCCWEDTVGGIPWVNEYIGAHFTGYCKYFLDAQFGSTTLFVLPLSSTKSSHRIAIHTSCNSVLQSTKISKAEWIRGSSNPAHFLHTTWAIYNREHLMTCCNSLSNAAKPGTHSPLLPTLWSTNTEVFCAPLRLFLFESDYPDTSHLNFSPAVLQAEIFWFPSPRKQEALVQSSRYGVARSQFQSSDEFLSLHLFQSSFLSIRLFIRSLGKDIPSLHLEIAPKRSFDTTEE